jgi:hypothetical protein
MDTLSLRAEHGVILRLVSQLGGRSRDVKSREDADHARLLIGVIDLLLNDHLAHEDAELYPALSHAPDPETRALGASASEEMGGLAGAWINYRDHWTRETILAHARRFGAATDGFIRALSLRIEMENDILYPAMDRLSDAQERSAA